MQIRSPLSTIALAIAIIAAGSGTAYAQTAPTGCTPQDPLLSAPPVGAVGTGAYAGGGGAYAVGDNAAAEGLRDFAIGTNAFAGGSVGDASTACDFAIGDTAIAEGSRDLSISVDAFTNGTMSVAIGNGANATGVGVVAIGFANATADQSIAIGLGAASSASGAVAIGSGASAAGSNAVAIGTGSYANRGNAVSIGDDGVTGTVPFERQLINLAAGTQPFDAVNLQQLDASGSAIAAWIGGGANFEASGTGTFTSPMFVLTNPYTPGAYTTVNDALTALDTAITDVSKQPGPQGPAGPTGPQGPQGNAGATGATGPAGKDGANAVGGTGTDPLAVHYNNATDALVSLQGHGGTQVRNLAAGTDGTDAVNVNQLQEALKSANAYTDIRSVDTLNEANAYTNLRVAGLNARINYALAAASSNANAAAAVAAQDPAHHNRVAVSDGLASGVNAWTVMYQHLTAAGVTWNVSLTGEQGGGSSSDRQVGIGVGYSW